MTEKLNEKGSEKRGGACSWAQACDGRNAEAIQAVDLVQNRCLTVYESGTCMPRLGCAPEHHGQILAQLSAVDARKKMCLYPIELFAGEGADKVGVELEDVSSGPAGNDANDIEEGGATQQDDEERRSRITFSVWLLSIRIAVHSPRCLFAIERRCELRCQAVETQPIRIDLPIYRNQPDRRTPLEFFDLGRISYG